MLDDLDRTLEELLKRSLPPTLADSVSISFATPDEQFPPSSVTPPALDLFLYDVRENRDLRTTERIVERQSDGTAVTAAPLVRIDCSYLITAWASENSTTVAQDEHLLLGETMKVLLRYATLPTALLQGSLTSQSFPVLTRSLQTGQFQSLAEFWQTLGGKPKAALNYTVTIAIEPSAPVETEALVTDKLLRLAQYP
jgi:hypothetical protein